MITNKGRELFHTVYKDINVAYEQWEEIMEALSLLSRHAKTHRHLCEYACNGDPLRNMYNRGMWTNEQIDKMAQEREAQAEKRQEKLEERIEAIAATLPHVQLEMQQDPRGSTVKLVADIRTYYLN